jgi:hypothetical protein
MDRGRFRLDLPFHLPLQEGHYAARLRGVEVTFEHTVVGQPSLDPRLGGFTGTFGFQSDPLGLLRYSRVGFELARDEQDVLEREFFGDALDAWAAPLHERRVRLALSVCNHFLDQYRASTGQSFVHPLGRQELAFLRYECGEDTGEVRLYGGGFTQPISGLTPASHAGFVAQLALDEEPASDVLAALDAERLVDTGSTNAGLVVAVGALESGLDAYFDHRWRVQIPRTTPAAAAQELNVTKGVVTFADVLAAGTVSDKLAAFEANEQNEQVDDFDLELLREGIEARNLVVHGGINVPAGMAKKQVRAIHAFLTTVLRTATTKAPARPAAAAGQAV